MRLMVIGHPFLLAHNQKKYVAMKHLDPELKLRLVAPSRGRDRFDLADCQVHPALASEEVVPLKAHLARSHMTYVHSPWRLAAILREFHPDVIHIEEEPQALITVETITLQRTFAPRAAVTLFTWDNLLRRRRFPLDSAKRGLRSYSLRRTRAVICGNRRSAELLCSERRFQGPIEVLPQYGVDAAEHEPGTEPQLRSKLGLESGVVIGYAGRLVPEKGLRLLFEALGKLRDYPWKLLLVGAGPLESEIRQQWMKESRGRIVLVPAVPSEQVPQYLRCADIFVLPSYSTPSWMEQFGLALTQAMMLGIPCIGSSSGAIPEVLGPGGLVFEEGNPGKLARALEELLQTPSQRERLGVVSREFALRNYTTEGVAARYLAAFGRAVSETSVLKREVKTAR
jgi:glycosyltransferase involved in cell wall biosynthesis